MSAQPLEQIIRGGTVVTEQAVLRADIGIVDGKIAFLEPDLQAAGREEVQAEGLHVFPGVLDAHVHFNEPGRTEWEGFATGSSALAAGGGTLFVDMPLNASPPTLNAESFALKRAAAEAHSVVDFALWGGLVPENLDRLPELAECGVVGFKAFMADSGMDDFHCVDEKHLRAGMKQAASLGLPVAVHAESEAMTQALAQERLSKGQTSAWDFIASRPVAAELEAITRAIELAGETGCSLHVVHVSSGAGVALITEARNRGLDVSCETCPHYLVLTEADMDRLGAVAKCAPPLRPLMEQAELWQRVFAGEVTTIGSDHSPSLPEMKTGANFFKVWGGIAGVQHTLPLLITEGHILRHLALPLIAQLTAYNVARRFRFPNKGRLEVGADADLALVDLSQRFEIRRSDLLCRHRQSPYVGRQVEGRVVQTLLRGQTVFRSGKITARPGARLVKPAL